MPSGSWRATSRSMGGGGLVAVERGGLGLGGSLGNTAFLVKSGDATTATAQLHATTLVTARGGFVAVALGKPKAPRVDDRKAGAHGRVTPPGLSVSVRGTAPGPTGTGLTSFVKPKPPPTEEESDLRPGDDEDGFYRNDEPIAQRKARWAADAREAAGVRALERAARGSPPWGAVSIEGEGGVGRDGDGDNARRGARGGKLPESVVALAWRLKAVGGNHHRGLGYHYGREDLPTAFRELAPFPWPKHWRVSDESDVSASGEHKAETRNDEASAETKRRVDAKVTKRFLKFCDQQNDPEFSAWETHTTRDSRWDARGKSPGPKPTFMPAFKKKNAKR
jgi:hypothetical protein